MYIKKFMDMLHINDICFKKSIGVETFNPIKYSKLYRSTWNNWK